VLQDWNGGAIPFYTLPPARGNEAFESAEVVAQWASEFDADKVFAAEQKAVIAHLPGMDGGSGGGGADGGGGGAFFEAASAGRTRMDLPEVDATGMDEGSSGSGEEGSGEDGSGEEGMEADSDDYGAPAAKRKKAAAGAAAPRPAAAAGAALYGEDGQFNPHTARSAKKARKKAKALAESMGGGGDDSDFDFDEANEAGADGEAGGSGSEGGSEEYGEARAGRDADRAYADAMEGSDLEGDE
jgi:nuclear GTP-binding protein